MLLPQCTVRTLQKRLLPCMPVRCLGYCMLRMLALAANTRHEAPPRQTGSSSHVVMPDQTPEVLLDSSHSNLQRLAREVHKLLVGQDLSVDEVLDKLLQAKWHRLDFSDTQHCLKFHVETPNGATLHDTQTVR